jgi:cytochrome P450
VTTTTTTAAAVEAPLVRGLPLLGSLRELQKGSLAFFERVRDETGDVARITLGPRKALAIADPRWIEHVLVNDARGYSKQTRGYEMLRKLIGNGLVTSEGSFWLRQRRIAQPAFHRERIAGFATLMRRAAEDMVARWQPGASFDAAAEMMRVTLRIVGEALFSTDVTADSDAVGAAVNELVHQAVERAQSILFVPEVVPTPMNRRFKHATGVLDRIVLGIIAERRASEREQRQGKRDLLGMLMATVDEETGERMDDVQLRDEVMTILIAGHETTANLLAWTLQLLGEHPGVEERLREEIAPLAGTAPAVEAVMRLPLLDAVLKESMRLYPPVWILARLAEKDDEIGGFRVHKKDFVFMSQWAVHRHPKLWPDPTRFDPQRFLDDPDGERRHKYAYFPFSGGNRKCIGDFFALLEAKIILVTVLQRARLVLASGTRPVPDPTVTLRPKGGVLVRLAV